jgi:dienelactone hydrolase
MYGNGKSTEHPEEAGKMATEVRKNFKAWQGRAQAALKFLKEQEQGDPTRLAAIDYCFGGSTALQLAYTGADLAAVVTFHAALPVPEEAQAKAVKAGLLDCHGAVDRFIPEETAAKFHHPAPWPPALVRTPQETLRHVQAITFSRCWARSWRNASGTETGPGWHWPDRS